MKKLLLMMCAISANMNFAMEPRLHLSGSSDSASYAGQGPQEAAENESPVNRFLSQQKKSSVASQDMLEAFLAPEDKKRIDEPTGNNNNIVAPEKPSFATEKLSHLFKMVRANAPKRVQMVLDEATKTDARIKMCEAAAVVGAECCGYCCCPDFTYAVNLLSIGWVGHIIYKKFTAKEKEL